MMMLYEVVFLPYSFRPLMLNAMKPGSSTGSVSDPGFPGARPWRRFQVADAPRTPAPGVVTIRFCYCAKRNSFTPAWKAWRTCALSNAATPKK
jgi:hypothetical protein